VSTYLDSSFAVSLYSPDANYLNAFHLMQSTSDSLLISMLCELETLNAFRLRVFRKEATPQEADRSIRYFELDLDSGVLERQPVPVRSFSRANQVSIQYAAQLGVRTADLLHIAAALELGSTEFFSFDIQQRKLADAVGLTLNPI
jgi:predicted nucleic acid-binding protein